MYHGGLPLSKRSYSPPAKISRSFFSSVVWNKWLVGDIVSSTIIVQLHKYTYMCLYCKTMLAVSLMCIQLTIFLQSQTF